jgi:hypothetical protein
VKEDGMDRECSTNMEKRNVCRILVEKAERKRPLGRSKHRWVDNIETNLAEMGWDGMVWIDLAEDRDQWIALVNAVMNLTSNAGKFLSSCTNGDFSRMAELHGGRWLIGWSVGRLVGVGVGVG